MFNNCMPVKYNRIIIVMLASPLATEFSDELIEMLKVE